MTKIFKIPFATQGDRTAIPDAVQGDGSVSYTQGYSYDYERDQNSDPAAKDIEREKMNALFHDITEALGESQALGVAKWGEEGKPYSIRSLVYHNNKIWQSKIENNNVEPVAGAAWSELKADITANELNVYTKTETDTKVADAKKAGTDAQTLASTANTNATNANNNANGRVPSTRKVNNKPLSTDINLTAGDVGAYDKSESDTRFQPKGNYAPAGNYQPAGDYATNAALNNGLALKFDKAGGTISGVVNVQKNIQATGEVAVRDDDDVLSMKTANASTLGPHFVSKRKSTNTYRTHSLPDKTGTLMHVGDYGFGGNGSGTDLWVNWTAAQVENFFKTGVSSIWRNQQETTPYAARYGASFYVRSNDTFWNMNVNHDSGDVLISNGVTGRAPSTFKIAKLFSTLNTTSDRNGCLRIANASTELSDCQVGIPLPWPQATAPAGYLICNGQWFNKTNYPLLAKAYPSGQLPDLRGEFIRGLDAGRNVDSGRAVLSAQSDAMQNMTGSFAIGGAKTESETPAIADGVFTKSTVQGSVNNSSGSVSGVIPKINFNPSSNVRTANENRPRNIAFLYILRAA